MKATGPGDLLMSCVMTGLNKIESLIISLYVVSANKNDFPRISFWAIAFSSRAGVDKTAIN